MYHVVLVPFIRLFYFHEDKFARYTEIVMVHWGFSSPVLLSPYSDLEVDSGRRQGSQRCHSIQGSCHIRGSSPIVIDIQVLGRWW